MHACPGGAKEGKRTNIKKETCIHVSQGAKKERKKEKKRKKMHTCVPGCKEREKKGKKRKQTLETCICMSQGAKKEKKKKKKETDPRNMHMHVLGVQRGKQKKKGEKTLETCICMSWGCKMGDMHGDMLVACIDMGALNFSDLPLINITEIMSIYLATAES